MAARPSGWRPGAPGDGALVARGEGLQELTAALRLAGTPDDVLSVLVLDAERVFGAAAAFAYVLTGATLELAAVMGPAEDADGWLRSVPVAAQLSVARVVRDGRPCWCESRAALGAAFPRWVAPVPHAERFGAAATLPLRAGAATLGAVGFAFDQERAFPAGERAAFESAAREGALALARVRGVAGSWDARGLAKAP